MLENFLSSTPKNKYLLKEATICKSFVDDIFLATIENIKKFESQ